ncbi:MAG: tRNA (adenosine(37)-N6)-threonylcarbamoyltransferase complex ATPase subunit type 1 TsaE [Saccharofermentans sp.]|nr:tRNA (adenosine(37)-N6)-threonylcarbamoyltransferase complex ATPase subunit type 1 TsaE [Saccharofermentans sp.]
MTTNYKSDSVEATEAIGQELAATLVPGSVVALDGDLGAGKTQFTRGICRGLGLDSEDVCSPTFTIVNEYTYPEDKMPLFHFDTYRLSGVDDFLASGLDEYFYRGGVCVIEWSSIIEELLPADTIKVTITGVGSTRDISITRPEV